ncbi:MAG: S24 family peptidase [Sphingomonas aquatilis]|uniref:S24 family peptidase n=1 Tax=Sphingomonas aquatilis TaxID=93063 RepID=UPI002F2BD0C8
MQQNFCSPGRRKIFVGAGAMDAHLTDPDAAQAWMIRERKKRGWSTSKVADVARAIARREGSEMKLTQQSVSGFETGDPKRMPEWMRYVRMAFEEGEPEPDADTQPRDEVVYIRQLDIRYALGPGAAIERATSATLVPFNLGFIQSITRSPTERLFIATGFGDSMEPVLLKHDLVLIDANDTSLDLGDTLWALEYAGSGLIKRLRAVMRDGKRKLVIMSANPDYPAEEADPKDVRIIGKVVWVARRM